MAQRSKPQGQTVVHHKEFIYTVIQAQNILKPCAVCFFIQPLKWASFKSNLWTVKTLKFNLTSQESQSTQIMANENCN